MPSISNLKPYVRSRTKRKGASQTVLGARERLVLGALLECFFPEGAILSVRQLGTGETPVPREMPLLDRCESWIARIPPHVRLALRLLLRLLDIAPLLTGQFRRFPALPRTEQVRLLHRWAEHRSAWVRAGFLLLKTATHLPYYDLPEVRQALGIDDHCLLVPPTPSPAEPIPYQERVVSGEVLPHDQEEVCDVCVIGTGAGGAVVAKELAEAGLSVVMLEEGGYYYTPQQFIKRPSDMMPLLYRDSGFTFAIGNTLTLMPLGKAVGGTTVINSGTCFRIPDKVLRHWQKEHGLADISPDSMAPYFEAVEQFLKVAPVSDAVLGRNPRFLEKGARLQGWTVKPLLRNSVNDCGCGVCAFGCPSGSKQAMHQTYVPKALELGARLYTHTRAERLLWQGNRLVGVCARTRSNRTVRLFAKVVVLCAGAIYTPVFLLRNRALNRSGQVGRNLSCHPAVRVACIAEEPIEPWKGVPQSSYIDALAEEGILLETITVPPSIEALALPSFGIHQQEWLRHYRFFASCGVMVADESRGRVRQVRGYPLITYSLCPADTQRLVKGILTIGRLFFLAGARQVFTGIYGHEIVRSLDELKAIDPASVKPSDLKVSSYHPLGTARMGVDPRTSVVNSVGQSHEIPNLFIADGSIFPSCLGVNPQIGIMAFAMRTARWITSRWEHLGA